MSQVEGSVVIHPICTHQKFEHKIKLSATETVPFAAKQANGLFLISQTDVDLVITNKRKIAYRPHHLTSSQIYSVFSWLSHGSHPIIFCMFSTLISLLIYYL